MNPMNTLGEKQMILVTCCRQKIKRESKNVDYTYLFSFSNPTVVNVVCLDGNSSNSDHYYSVSVHAEDDNENTIAFSKLHSDSSDVPPSTNPVTWINLPTWQREIVLDGPPQIQNCFHMTNPDAQYMFYSLIWCKL